jgi:hypothetical protein
MLPSNTPAALMKALSEVKRFWPSLSVLRSQLQTIHSICDPSVPSSAPEDDTRVGGLQAASSRIGLYLSTDWVAAARAEIPVFAPRLPKQGDWSQRSRRPYQPGALAAKT